MIVPSLAQKGPCIVARDLCEQFTIMGHYCELLYFDDIFGLKTTCKTTKISRIRDINPDQWDIIHSHGFRPDHFCYRLSKDSMFDKCKLVSTQHQPITIKELNKTFPILKSIIGSLLWTKYIKKFHSIVVLNSDTYNHLPNSLKPKTSIIFNGRSIEINPIGQEDKVKLQSLQKQYKIIGTHSVIIKRKGLEQMIKALPLLPEYAFVAIGDGEDRKNLESLAQTMNVSERCIFMGYKANSVDYLPFFDIFVMCTRSEGFPLALIEAASQGLPTVLSDIPILKSIIDDKKVTFYKLDDIKSLVNAIKEATSNKKGDVLKEYYLNNLTAQAMAKRYLSMYQKVIKYI